MAKKTGEIPPGRDLHPETLLLHHGYGPETARGALKPPVYLTSAFTFPDAQAGKDAFDLFAGRPARDGAEPGLIYSRLGNPNLHMLEERLAALEGADDGLVFASGMAAISTTFLTLLRPGDVVVYNAPLYSGTEDLILNTLPDFGIRSLAFDSGAPPMAMEAALAQARRMGRVGALYIETPANPTNALVDLAFAAGAARRTGQDQEHRVPVIVDNTILGPLWQKPIAHGCDLVIYSLTKYIGGHSDLVAGACLGASDLIKRIRRRRTGLGTQADPHTSWLVMRSLETLALRMRRSADSAKAIARFLAGHPKVETVHFLDLLPPDDPNRALYARQCGAAGATFSFEVKGGQAEAFRLLDHLRLITLTVSFGSSESLISHPATTTHSELGPERLALLKITPAMLRLSVGLEHPDDLIADLAQALETL